MPDAATILERLDAIAAALAELRAEVADNAFKSEAVDLDGAEADDEKGVGSIHSPADDLADGNLLDTTSAAVRFGYPADSIRKWCREEGLGVRRGGRWLVSISRLQKRINGG